MAVPEHFWRSSLPRFCLHGVVPPERNRKVARVPQPFRDRGLTPAPVFFRAAVGRGRPPWTVQPVTLAATGLEVVSLLATVSAGSLGAVLERRTKVGSAVGGALIAFGVRAMLAVLVPGLAGAASADLALADVLLPLALALTVVAAQADLGSRRAALAGPGSSSSRAGMGSGLRSGLRVLVAFVFGALGSLLGAVTAFAASGFLGLQAGEAARAAGCVSATYIGGSVNFAAAARALHLEPSIFATLASADIGLMGLYFAGLSSLASSSRSRALRGFLGGSAEPASTEASASSRSPDVPLAADSTSRASRTLPASGLTGLLGLGEDRVAASSTAQPRVTAAALLLIATCGSLWAAGAVAARVGGGPGVSTAAITGCAWLAGGLLRYLRMDCVVYTTASLGRRSGALLMLVFFSAVGAQVRPADFLTLGGRCAGITAFVSICLVVHATTVLLASAAFNLVLQASGRPGEEKLSLDEILVASNANVGGASTAAAFAGASLGRADLVMPATCCGILGYAVATSAGVAIARFLGA
ncbi:unnamed protein product [Polarella glacialis]|uniref:Uncharacterized protein n=1 Tax=Polarella glacialis TaxID=89957 RepID=A0A813GX02_POLGL|nr:unnamed protein product [Polarella glacialis]CAE8635690.1 unnamed protein product [Polarella glacialis]